MTDPNAEANFQAQDGNHVAGEVLCRRQRCLVCGGILIDYRNVEVAAVVVPGEPAPSLSFWPPGPVHRQGNMTGVGHLDELEECKP